MRVWVMILQRKFPEALQAIEQFPKEVLETHSGQSPKAFFEGLIYQYQGDKAKAQAAFERARVVAEQLGRESPSDALLRALLAEILAALGQKGPPISEGKPPIVLLPQTQHPHAVP